MLHRALQAFPWATSPSGGEPGDLPDSYGVDALMLAPVNPERLFATWEITWATRNRLLEELGEEVLPLCRLVLRLNAEAGGDPWQEVDVSGPSRSWYLDLEAPPSRLSGELGCQDPEGGFHGIVACDPVDLPSPGAQADGEVAEEVYERLSRSVGMRPEALFGPRGMMSFAEGRDARLGRPGVG